MREIIKIILTKFRHTTTEAPSRLPQDFGLRQPMRDDAAQPFLNVPRPAADVIVVVNQKGGCGKTTTVVNVSAYLAHLGYKVLLVDLDPQAHASLGLGIKVDSLEKTIYHCLIHNLDMEQATLRTGVSGLDIVPASNMLSGAALEIANVVGRENILKTMIKRMAGSKYDFIFIDCSPSLSLLTLNALVAAKFVLIPIQVHYYSLEGMKELFSTIDIVKERLNPELEILGILATLFDMRIKINRQILEQISSHFRELLFNTVVHNSAKLCEAPFYKKPIHIYDPQSRGAQDYINFTGELIARINKKRYDANPASADSVPKELIVGREETGP